MLAKIALKAALTNKKAILAFMFIPMLMFLGGCATLSSNWATLTGPQQARVIEQTVQSNLSGDFQIGQQYAAANPTDTTWKVKVLPAFNLANQALYVAIGQSVDGGTFNLSQLYSGVVPLVTQAEALLKAWGINLPSTTKNTSIPVTTWIDIIEAGIQAVESIVSGLGNIFLPSSIPTVATLQAANQTLQASITAALAPPAPKGAVFFHNEKGEKVFFVK